MEEMTIHLLATMKGFGEIKEFTAEKNNKYFGNRIEIKGTMEDGTEFSLSFTMKKEANDA